MDKFDRIAITVAGTVVWLVLIASCLPPNQQQDQTDEQQNTTRQSLPPSVSTVSPPTTEPEEHSPTSQSSNCICRVLLSPAAPDWALVFIGLITAFVAIETLKAIKQQIASNAAAANAASISAQVAGEALRKSQRATVNIARFGFGPDSPNPAIATPQAILELRNSGSQPAKVTHTAVLLYKGAEDPPTNPTDAPWKFEERHAVIAPGIPYVLTVPLPGGMAQPDWKQMQTGDLPVHIVGIIKYETGFTDVPGETGFGFTYRANDTSRSAPERFSIAKYLGYNYSS